MTIKAAIVGLGRWGLRLVEAGSVPANDKIRFTTYPIALINLVLVARLHCILEVFLQDPLNLGDAAGRFE